MAQLAYVRAQYWPYSYQVHQHTPVGLLLEAELSEILLDADPLATLSLAEPSVLLDDADAEGLLLDGLPDGSDSDGADALGADSLGALAEPLGALSDGADSLALADV